MITFTNNINYDTSVYKYSKEYNAHCATIFFTAFTLHNEKFDWVLRHTDTVLVIWRHSSFTGGGRPQVPFFALFQA
jgi:hypothetical protein